jgi:hypothetical protein
MIYVNQLNIARSESVPNREAVAVLYQPAQAGGN